PLRLPVASRSTTYDKGRTVFQYHVTIECVHGALARLQAVGMARHQVKRPAGTVIENHPCTRNYNSRPERKRDAVYESTAVAGFIPGNKRSGISLPMACRKYRFWTLIMDPFDSLPGISL